jgi:hypothetical protein
MFGSISAWFWKYLAGITPLEDGWRKVRVAPSFGELCLETDSDSVSPPLSSAEAILGSVEATLGTVAGDVHIQWELDTTTRTRSDRFGHSHQAQLHVRVPVHAEVVMPCVPKGTEIIEVLSGTVVWRDNALQETSLGALVRSGMRDMSGGVVFQVGAGEYMFRRQQRDRDA